MWDKNRDCRCRGSSHNYRDRVLRRDDIEIFLQHQPGYVMSKEHASLPGVKVSRQLGRQEYGMLEFDLMDLNGYRLVFAQPAPAK